ncbi:MAG: TetR/AcrR family transcriptional regulator [Nitrospirota bacterium]
MNKRSGIESKQRIIKAAMDVFSVKGYAKASVREIAKAADISVGGVYLYFRNKEELYKSLINEKMQEAGASLRFAAGGATTSSEALYNLLKAHLENALKHKEFILVHIREHGFSFGIQEKRKFFREQRALIERIIRKGIQAGEFRECDPEETAKIIMGSLRGILLSIALDQDVHVMPEMLYEFILKGIQKKQ